MSNSSIRFVDPDRDKTIFFATLRKRVDAYFRERNLSKHYNASMVFKTIVLIGRIHSSLPVHSVFTTLL